MNKIETLRNLISQSQQIVITTHVSPDGDAIGSSLALWHYLKNIGKKATVIVPNSFADFIAWLPETNKILIYDTHKEEAASVTEKADLIFCLDFNEPKRTDNYAERLTESKATKVLIDHHLGNPNWQDLNLSVQTASSTCELIFDTLFALEKQDLSFLTTEIATCIYVGILTDTGNFQYSATTSHVHQIVAHLIDAGVQPADIHNIVNNSFSINRLQFFGYCVHDKMKIVKDKKLAYIFITEKDIKKYNITLGDTEGLVNESMKISDIQVSALFKQEGNKIKISMRSKGDIDVSQFLRTYFSGGGHKNAAGGVSFDSLKETEEKFITNLARL